MREQDPRQLFAERLSLLWVEAGKPTYEALAREAQNRTAGDVLATAGGSNGRPTRVTKQRISDWRNGKQVPRTFGTLSPVLGVLIPEARKRQPTPVLENLYDGAAWKLWWSDAASAVDGSAPAAADGGPEVTDDDHAAAGRQSANTAQICPYRGLAAFGPEHAGFFHGRERATETLVDKLTATLHTGGMIALVGASGAGKSSLLRAGLLPAMHGGALSPDDEQWAAVVHTPGEDPVAQLIRDIPDLVDLATGRNSVEPGAAPGPTPDADPDAADTDEFVARIHTAIRRYAERDGGPGARLLLVVDQAEELFTLCSDNDRRDLYIDTLAAACTPGSSGEPAAAVVLFAVRADFYQRCMDFPDLADALQHRQMLLGPMRATELREAITGPAHAVGLRLEPGLVELLTRDMGIRTARSRNLADNSTYDAGVLPLLSHALRATWQHRKGGKLTIAGYRTARGIQGAVEATAERAWAELDPAGQTAAMQTLVQLTRLSYDTQDARRRYDKQRLIDQAHDSAATERALETLVAARLVTLDEQTVEITHEALLHAWPRLRQRIDKDRAGILVRQELEEDAAQWAPARDSALLYRGSRLSAARTWGTSEEHREELSPVAVDFLKASMAQQRRSAHLRRTAIAMLAALSIIASIAAIVATQARDRAIFTQIVSESDRLRPSDPSLAAQLDLVAQGLRPDDPGVAGRILSTQNSPLAALLPGEGTAAVDYTGVSPDGRTLATAGNSIRLWDISAGRAPRPLGPEFAKSPSYISAAAFSPDGRILASTGGDGVLRLWDVSDLTRPRLLAEQPEGQGSSSLLAFTPNGRTVATASYRGVAVLWDVTDPTRPRAIGAPLGGHVGIVRSVAFSPDGRLFAAGGDDKTTLLWDVTDLTQPRRVGPPLIGHSEAVRSVAFSPDGRTLATSSDDKTARLWDITSPTNPAPLGEPLLGHKGPIWSVAFSPDGRTLATGAQDGAAKLWNVASRQSAGQIGADLAARTGGLFALAFTPDGRRLVTGGDDGTTLVWTLPTTALAGPTSRVFAVAISPDGRTLAAASYDHNIWLWDTTQPMTPTPLGPPLVGHTGDVVKVVFSPDGRTLVSQSGKDRTIRVWDLTDRTRPTPIGAPITTQTQYWGALAFSPDGRVLVTSDTDTTVQLWDPSDRQRLTPFGAPIPGHGDFVQNVAISPDSRTLAVPSYSGVVEFWDITDPAKPTRRAEPLDPGTGKIRSAAFSPDGRTLATSGEDKTVRLWDVTDLNSPQPREVLTGHNGAILHLAFSPDSSRLASVSADKTARLWKLAASDTKSEPLTGHTGKVNGVAFTPDGSTLVTGSDDETTQLWNLDVKKASDRICATTQGVLTEDQWNQLIPTLSYDKPCPD